MKFSIGQKVYYTNILSLQNIWVLHEAFVVSVGENVIFLFPQHGEILKMSIDKVFATKKAALIKVPDGIQDFNDDTSSGLTPVDKLRLNMTQKIESAKTS